MYFNPENMQETSKEAQPTVDQLVERAIVPVDRYLAISSEIRATSEAHANLDRQRCLNHAGEAAIKFSSYESNRAR